MPAARRHARTREKMRDAIVAAARALFVRDGYANVSMRKIADRVGCSAASIYNYFPDKADVDRSYVTLMERLLAEGNYPGIATHDDVIIRHAQGFVQRNRIGPDRFEFQMLYGVRRDLQARLHRGGHRMRVYIPFGTQWYPYLMRRLAERPANIAFILGNVVKESVPGW